MIEGHGTAGQEESDFGHACEGRNGSGIRSPATPSCRLPRLVKWVVVERCDVCERYPNDLSAAAAVFDEVKWIRCAAGGWHAVGRQSSAISQPPVLPVADVPAIR